MSESIHKNSGQSALVLVGILLTIAAVVAHRFLPERRLVLNSTTGATYFLMHSPDGPQAQVEWSDQARFHYTCQFAKDAANPSCSFVYLLYAKDANVGSDLSRYRTLHLAMRYAG